jgi:hypothetical protein
MQCCWIKSSLCFEEMYHLHIYGFVVHDMLLQNIRECLHSNTSYLKIQNPGLYHTTPSKAHNGSYSATSEMCVCAISRSFKNHKLQQSILCAVYCIIFMLLLKMLYQMFVRRAERKNTSPFYSHSLFSILICHIIGELMIGSHLSHENFGTQCCSEGTGH